MFHLTADHLDTFRGLDSYTEAHTKRSKTKQPCMTILYDMFETPLLLFFISLAATCLSWLIVTITSITDDFSLGLLGPLDDVRGWGLYLSWSVGLALLSCFVTQKICPDAVGGGLPEVKFNHVSVSISLISP